MPRRGGPVQHCPPRCVFAFPLCCLLIDRVAAVRSVDFAAEESVVAPPGGAPGTPAGYCWLLDMSLRRVTRSGWTCGVGDGTMTYEPRKDDSRSRSYVRRPFAFLFFFPSPGAERRRLSGGAGAECVGGRLGQIFVSASSKSHRSPDSSFAQVEHLRGRGARRLGWAADKCPKGQGNIFGTCWKTSAGSADTGLAA